MVIHEEGETPAEVSIIRKPLFEPKTYVFVENHVRELKNNVESKPSVGSTEEEVPLNMENTTKKVMKASKKNKKNVPISQPSMECEENTKNNVTEISKSDLEELRSAYVQCKAVVEKIERKYGHLINDLTEAGTSYSQHQKRRIDCEEYQQEDVCQCALNRKTVFDDDGQQIQIDITSHQDIHICPKKLKQTQNYNIQVEYTENEIELSNSLQELVNILEDPDIEITYRNKVIDKVKAIRQEQLNEIRFNKHALIEKLKANPDEVLDFKGTNLSTLPGYS